MNPRPLTKRLDFERVPRALVGAGITLIAIMVVEVVSVALSPTEFTIVTVANFLATLPFVVILVVGGSWLSRSNLSTERYPRIAAWTVGGFGFITVFFTIIAVFTQDSLLIRIGIVRWAAAAGAGSGALVGIFETRAISRAVAVERTQIRNEELTRQNDRLEEFANILAHDLRNPLTVADGYVDLLREEHDGEALERITAAHDRMEQIIEETLILARSGQMIDEPELVSLSDLVDRCWANVETRSARIGVVDTATIVADPDRVQHLFENLFRNAIEHAGKDVTIRVGTLPNGFYIEDDGPGFPADARTTVVESGYSTKRDGTGFGLAIVGQIVEAHDWDMRLTGGADGGARIEITGVDVDQARGPEVTDEMATAE